MREKLIELIGQVQDCGCDVTDVVEMNYVENDVLVDHLIANGVTVQKWIPVTERLPEIDQPCLCYKRAHREDGYKLGRYLGASFSKECAAFRSMSHYGCIGVTHWMPLPEPPKGE